MALYHFSVRHVSRGKGQMVVASAAYISGQRIYDGYYNKIHDHTSKSGVVFTEIHWNTQKRIHLADEKILVLNLNFEPSIIDFWNLRQ